MTISSALAANNARLVNPCNTTRLPTLTLHKIALASISNCNHPLPDHRMFSSMQTTPI